MQSKEFAVMGSKIRKRSFDSIEEFYEYISTTPTSRVFVGHERSKDSDEKFRGTKSFEEATELLKNGWTQGAKELVEKLKTQKQLAPSMKLMSYYDVAGFQASVPRYLQGIPTNMINKRSVPCKQKVVNIIKSLNYPGATKKEQIVEQSVIALQIVKKLESQGVRVNLFVELGSEVRSSRAKSYVYVVKVKSASERLNVSKVAFPLVHPSMLRRFMFRCIEVEEGIESDYVFTYGYPISSDKMKASIESKSECFIPAFVSKEMVDGISSTDEMLEYLGSI